MLGTLAGASAPAAQRPASSTAQVHPLNSKTLTSVAHIRAPCRLLPRSHASDVQRSCLPHSRRPRPPPLRAAAPASASPPKPVPASSPPPSSAVAAEVLPPPAAGGDAWLDTPLRPNPKLRVGFLPNGLRYVVLPNASPPGRFEAHMEIHAGSVEEREHEQGIAHLVEHVTFLGSRRREALLGTGARSNAYTDFHHTVFHVHAPFFEDQQVGLDGLEDAPAPAGERPLDGPGSLLAQTLDALAEVAFEPEFLPSRIDKERAAVASEAQTMNGMEYRVDCALLRHLHAENALGSRFPIGCMEQVARWSRAQLLEYWQRHYFPANATLYVVGDFEQCAGGEGSQRVVELIRSIFARVPPGQRSSPEQRSAGTDPFADPSLPPHAHVSLHPDQKRPPVEHAWGTGATDAHPSFPGVDVFQHRNLQLFQLSVFSKTPVRPLRRLRDLRRAFMVRLLLSVLQFRIGARYASSSPSPFSSVEVDVSDSGREGCAVSTLTVTARPGSWRDALRAARSELARMQRHGVTRAEKERYVAALLRDSGQVARSVANTPSADTLDWVMECLALGHCVLSHADSHAAVERVAPSVDVEELGALAREVFSFALAPGEEAGLRSGEARCWPTAVVAVLPAFMDESGGVAPGTKPLERGGGVATLHREGLEEESGAGKEEDGAGGEENGPGEEVAVALDPHAKPFVATPADISSALQAPLSAEALSPEADVEVPEALMAPREVEALLALAQPRWVPPPGLLQVRQLASAGELEAGLAEARPPPDRATGVTLRALSNGVRLNYRPTGNSPGTASIRVTAAGGRAREAPGAGPGAAGAVSLGVRALSEAGRVGRWSRQQVELFCISRLINCAVECDDEFVALDAHVVVDKGGLEAALQLLHLFLSRPAWDAAALERARQALASHARGAEQALDRAVADRVMEAALGRDRLFRDPRPEELEAQTLEAAARAVAAQLRPDNLEVVVVGDFEPAQLESLALKYLGTLGVDEGRDAADLGARSSSLEPFLSPITFEDVTDEASTTPQGEGLEPLRAKALVCEKHDGSGTGPRLVAFPDPPAAPLPPLPSGDRPIVLRTPPPEERHQTHHLQDSDERACALLAGPAPPRWAVRDWGRGVGRTRTALEAVPAPTLESVSSRQTHPLFASVGLTLLVEVLNSRLFTTVRDSLNLTYDVSMELSLYDRLPAAWWHVSLASTPQRVGDALEAALRVLRSPGVNPVAPRELARAARSLLARHQADCKDDGYWVGLLTHLQCPEVPGKRIECLRDLERLYGLVTAQDVASLYALFDFGDDAVFSCVGSSGRGSQARHASPILARMRRAQEGEGDAKPASGSEALLSVIRSFMDSGKK